MFFASKCSLYVLFSRLGASRMSRNGPSVWAIVSRGSGGSVALRFSSECGLLGRKRLQVSDVWGVP